MSHFSTRTLIGYINDHISWLYDEEGIKNDPYTIREIEQWQNLQDNQQFIEVLYNNVMDRYWFMTISHSNNELFDSNANYMEFNVLFSHESSIEPNLYRILKDSNELSNKHLYYVNNSMIDDKTYFDFMHSILSKFNQTLDPNAYVRYLQSNKFDINDYLLNIKPLDYGTENNFKCVVDLDNINQECSNTPLNIVEVKYHIDYNTITLGVSLPDLVVKKRLSFKRDSIEDRTVAKSIIDFYLKILANIMESELAKL